MFDTAAKLLLESGYQSIGMDHFVRPNDELSIAMQTKNYTATFRVIVPDALLHRYMAWA